MDLNPFIEKDGDVNTDDFRRRRFPRLQYVGTVVGIPL